MKSTMLITGTGGVHPYINLKSVLGVEPRKLSNCGGPMPTQLQAARVTPIRVMHADYVRFTRLWSRQVPAFRNRPSTGRQHNSRDIRFGAVNT